MRAHLTIVSLLLLVALIAAGCQSEEFITTPTPVQWQRVAYIASGPQPGFALNIPADWHHDLTATGIVVFNDARVSVGPEADVALPAGSIFANITLLSALDAEMFGAHNAERILDAFIGAALREADGPETGETDLIQIGGRDLAQSFVKLGDSESLLIALELRGNYLLAVAVARAGELERQKDLLNLIFEGIELRHGG